VASLEISNDLIRERMTGRLAQVEAMREQVTKVSGARASGDNASLMRIKPALYDMVEKYMKDVDKDEKDGLAPDVVKTWKDQVYEVVKEALEFLDHFSGRTQPPGQKTAWPFPGRLLRLQPTSQRPWLKRFRTLARKGCGTSPGNWGPQKRR
jgi:hypothetical protein